MKLDGTVKPVVEERKEDRKGRMLGDQGIFYNVVYKEHD